MSENNELLDELGKMLGAFAAARADRHSTSEYRLNQLACIVLIGTTDELFERPRVFIGQGVADAFALGRRFEP